MISSLLHMWCRAKVGSMGNEGDQPIKGNRTVWALFIVSVASTIGLVVFFLRHRLLCRPMCKLLFKFFFILKSYSWYPAIHCSKTINFKPLWCIWWCVCVSMAIFMTYNCITYAEFAKFSTSSYFKRKGEVNDIEFQNI